MAADITDIAKVEKHIVELTNSVRHDHALAATAPNAALTKSARAYAEFLARSGQFSHTADGQDPGKRAQKAGYAACELAENLALHQTSGGFDPRDLAAKAMTGWINSPGHRANILNAHVTEIGVGLAKSTDSPPKLISVQLFGRPLAAAIEFQIVNTTATALSYKLGGANHDLAPHLSVTHKSCRPQSIAFEKPGGLFSGPTGIANVEARDGMLYTLKADAAGRLALDIGKRERIK